MTDQQRNADIARAVEHALNQAAIDAREWERQCKQWEAVVIAQRGELAALTEDRLEACWVQVRDASSALHAAGIPSEPHEPHDGCQTQLGHRVRDLAEHARKVDATNDALLALADQAISNLRAIVALNDDPHIDEICRVTADMLGATDQAQAALLRRAREEGV